MNATRLHSSRPPCLNARVKKRFRLAMRRLAALACLARLARKALICAAGAVYHKSNIRRIMVENSLLVARPHPNRPILMFYPYEAAVSAHADAWRRLGHLCCQLRRNQW
jgi:hypothetical protein